MKKVNWNEWRHHSTSPLPERRKGQLYFTQVYRNKKNNTILKFQDGAKTGSIQRMVNGRFRTIERVRLK